VPKVPKQLAELELVAARVSDKVKYPIKDYSQLARALGGDNATVDFEGKGRKLGQVKKMIPKGFFPVESREDLIARISHVYMQYRPVAEAHTPGEKRDGPPAESPEPKVPKQEKPRPGGLPGVRGQKREE